MARDPSQECFNLLWNVQVSVRYHMRRQAFFERWSRVTAATGVIFGSAALTSFFAVAPQWVVALAGLLVTVASVVDLVVGTAAMARKHDDLRRRFVELQADIECHPDDVPEDLPGWTRRRLVIEQDEPPTYFALLHLCENEQGYATGFGERTRMRRFVRWTANLLRWENVAPDPVGTPS